MVGGSVRRVDERRAGHVLGRLLARLLLLLRLCLGHPGQRLHEGGRSSIDVGLPHIDIFPTLKRCRVRHVGADSRRAGSGEKTGLD